MESKTGIVVPPGFRFHLTDEKLIIHYLRNQVTHTPCPVSIIPEVDIYKFDPWQLPGFGEKEWYFFTPRDRKYPNGARPNRAIVSGYWKATGTDKAIYSGSKFIGVKKALVFYKRRPPKGLKTNWIMHECRLIESSDQSKKKTATGSMRLDDWVLCRIYKKKHVGKSEEAKEEDPMAMMMVQTNQKAGIGVHDYREQQMMTHPIRTFSLAHLFDVDYYWAPISQLLRDTATTPASTTSAASYNSLLDFQSMGNIGGTTTTTTDHFEKTQLVENYEMANYNYGTLELGKDQVLNQSNSQPFCGN